jgi:hypothetical protein
MTNQWQMYTVDPDQTHHLLHGQPAYPQRFLDVLKFHSPGLAPVRDTSGAYHIDPAGDPVYPQRYLRTFGFYQERAAVQAAEGRLHLQVSGQPLYAERYAWCGNFQERRCPARRFDDVYVHPRLNGTVAYKARYRYAGDYRDGIAAVQQMGNIPISTWREISCTASGSSTLVSFTRAMHVREMRTGGIILMCKATLCIRSALQPSNLFIMGKRVLRTLMVRSW